MVFSITNQSERVFRGQGAVWSVSRDGSALPVSADGLLTLTILPGRTSELAVGGIPLPVRGVGTEGSVYVVSLIDLVTDRDAAGVATQRASYEWMYALEWQEVEPPDDVLQADHRTSLR